MATSGPPEKVGARGFEPPTPCSQSRCATGLRHAPAKLEVKCGKQDSDGRRAVVLCGKTAESASQYLTKGRQVYIEGRIRTRQWQDQSGQKRYTTEIIATNMTLLGGRSGAERAPEEVGATVPPDDPVAGEFGPGPDDDIPF